MQLHINVRNTKIADEEQAFLDKETCSLTFGSYIHFLLFMLLPLNVAYSLLHITQLFKLNDFWLQFYLQVPVSLSVWDAT